MKSGISMMFRNYSRAALVLVLVSGPVFSLAQEMTQAETP